MVFHNRAKLLHDDMISFSTLEKDKQGNLVHGKVILNNTKDSFFKSEDRLIEELGLII